MQLFDTVAFKELYNCSDAQKQRFAHLKEQFGLNFKGEPEFFSASGRCEIIGNHTDHNGGKVLAGSIDLDTVAAARKTREGVIRLVSEGYDGVFTVNIWELEPKQEERGTTLALIRGVAHRLSELGYRIGGFDACVTSNVLKGSGLSSSASFEVLICTVINHFYNDGAITPTEAAKVSQYAENLHFGKPCGLMDQLACAWGNMVQMDFAPFDPTVEGVELDFKAKGYSLVITDVRQDHADLTGEYAAITSEMALVAGYFGKRRLCEVNEDDFMRELPMLRKKCPDRAVLRAMHFFNENKRVEQATAALKRKDIQGFFDAVNASGASSQCLLQNLFAQGSLTQGVPLALELARNILKSRGAVRVHGGGFGGTVLAFVPLDLVWDYMAEMDRVFGQGASVELRIRKMGTAKID